MRNEGSVTIHRALDDVFRLTTNDVQHWSIVVVEDEMLEELPGGVGSTFRTVTQEKGRNMEFHGVITKHAPPYLHAVQLTGEMFDIEAEYSFERISDNETQVTHQSSVTGKGLFRLLLPVMGLFMKKSSCDALQQELNSLKTYCENHEPAAAS